MREREIESVGRLYSEANEWHVLGLVSACENGQRGEFPPKSFVGGFCFSVTRGGARKLVEEVFS